jgi:hypothetical protein
VCILRIILIIRLDITALLAELRQQICSTNIDLGIVPVTFVHVCHNLLVCIPNVVGRFAVYLM